MSRIRDFLYLRDAFGTDRAIIGAGRSLLRRLSAEPPHADKADPTPALVQGQPAMSSDVASLAGSTFLVREGTWDAAIAGETLNYLRLLKERNLVTFANVIDIGGHIGSFSIHLARQAKITGKIYALEPLKSNFDLIRKNIELNGFAEKIIPINAAASFRVGTSILKISSENTGGNHLSTSRSGNDEEVKTLDIAKLFDSIEGPIDLIKIDCEGWEFPIFKRLKTRLHKVKAIVGESHRTIFSDPAHQRHFLEKQGFKVEMFSDGAGFSDFFATNITRPVVIR